MRALATDILLGIAVLACWLGAAGFLRVRTALDRLHCVSFVNVVAGAAVAAAAFVSDGDSDRALKVLIVVAAALLSGAGLAHATGRALVERGRKK